MKLYDILLIVYGAILILVCLRILYETRNATKIMAYILFCVFVPVIGICFYLLFGFNYWKKRRYNPKFAMAENLQKELTERITQYTQSSINRKDEVVTQNVELAYLLTRELGSPLTRTNAVKLLVNGEEKFPELIAALKAATHHIHIEYYIFDNDEIGNTIIDLLLEKAQAGIKVRFIYDDFGSPSIHRRLVKKMTAAGVEVYTFHRVRFYLLANRINYRNHRKIVVIDGKTAFTGGINVSDKYINGNGKKLYWRDTHLRVDGPAVYYIQYIFLSDWNFCCGVDEKIQPGPDYFPEQAKTEYDCYVQIAAGGPDSMHPTIQYSILEAISLAKEEILITTPYFIPGDSIIDALCAAALSNLSVKLLVPGISDSLFVNAAARSYYDLLLQAGVEIYQYKKGFVHAKTMVTDGTLAIVGTANMDHRSFELNFEINAILYDAKLGVQLRNQFMADLKDAEKIDKAKWLSRPKYKQLPEKVARLFSPVM